MSTQLSFQLSEGHLSIIEAVLDSDPTDHVDGDDFLIEDLVCCRGSSLGLKPPLPSLLFLLIPPLSEGKQYAAPWL